MFDRNIWYQSSMVNLVLTEWVRMDFSTPPPKYEASEDFATGNSDYNFTPDTWTRHQCITDLSGMFDRNIWYQSSMVNLVLTEWVRMDFSTPPPKYEASRKVYLLRMADGSVAALQLKSYMSEAGTKGFLTIDVRYPLSLRQQDRMQQQ